MHNENYYIFISFDFLLTCLLIYIRFAHKIIKFFF